MNLREELVLEGSAAVTIKRRPFVGGKGDRRGRGGTQLRKEGSMFQNVQGGSPLESIVTREGGEKDGTEEKYVSGRREG